MDGLVDEVAVAGPEVLGEDGVEDGLGAAVAAAIRTLSPRMAPPVRGDDGSTASTAGRRPFSARRMVHAAVRVDFPEPGGPVSPTTWALPT